nr:glycosyltransferase family 2 protein [Arthrobacter roseus]
MRTTDRGLLLERAVSDVLGQSLQDWTLVIVNDGGSVAEVDDVVEQHSSALGDRVQVIHHDESVGMEAAANHGIRSSESEFIVVHDDDDTWHPDFLTRTVDRLRGSNDAGVAVRTEMVFERVLGTRIVEVAREIFEPDVTSVTLFDILRVNRFVPISVLYRRTLHDDVGYFDEDLSAVGDWEFLLRVLSAHTMSFIGEEPLAFWHHRREATGALGNSVIAKSDEHQRLDLLVRERHLKEHVKDNGLGALLYLTKHESQLADHLHQRKNYAEDLLLQSLEQNRQLSERLGRLEEAVSDASLVSLLRRRYRRLKDRLAPRA